MFQAATGIPMHSQGFLPVSQPLPSSGPSEFIPVSNEVPMQAFGRPSVVPEAPMPQHMAYPHPQDYNGMPGMVPTIMESTQPVSREGIVHSLQHAGYAVQHPPMSGPDDQFFANDVFANPTFSMPGEFPGPFTDMPPDMAEPFSSYNIPIPSIEGAQMSLQPVPSSASLAPSVASTYSHPSSYTEESSQVLTAATSTSPCDPADSNGFEANVTPPLEHAQSWEAQNPLFHHPNPSAPALLSSGDITEAPIVSTPPELSSDAFARRNSSTSGLTDSLNAVDIAVPNGDSDFKSPNQPSSLAARRQRPRPAALGAASLRSASYSVGMPASPGGNQNLAAPEQALRRIRSSGVTNPNRIQKPGSSSGQRSPMTLAFADAAASPKWGRMSSGSYGSTFVTSPAISVSAASSVAPPTPPTPNEYNQFPAWQTPGAKVINAAGEVINVNGVATSYPENGAVVSASGVPFSSPPTTPLDAEQQAQYRSWLAQQHAAHVYRDTPPQSAPASQQSFKTSFVTHYPPFAPSALALHPDKLGHLRRPSLPDGPHAVVPQHWPPVPLFTATGDLALTGSAEDGSMTAPPRVPFSNPFSGPAVGAAPPSPAHHVVPVPQQEFAVLQYAPPEGGIAAVGLPRADSAPKIYHFSNQGPRDFKG